jgi:hypothetical protein
MRSDYRTSGTGESSRGLRRRAPRSNSCNRRRVYRQEPSLWEALVCAVIEAHDHGSRGFDPNPRTTWKRSARRVNDAGGSINLDRVCRQVLLGRLDSKRRRVLVGASIRPNDVPVYVNPLDHVDGGRQRPVLS